MIHRHPLRPDRLRQIPPSFSWVDHRLVRHDYLRQAEPCAWTLYLFLVTVGASRFPGVAVIGVGSMLSAAYADLKARSFGRVEYSAPTREFLAAAAKRYGFLGMKDAPALVPLLVMGLFGALAVHQAAARDLSERGVALAVGAYLLFLVALCVFALIVSRKDWRREHAELLQETFRREHELETG
jgi:hypothetical protein